MWLGEGGGHRQGWMHLLQSKVGASQVIVAASSVFVVGVIVVVALQEARGQAAASQGGPRPGRAGAGGRLVPPHHPGLLLDQPRPASRTPRQSTGGPVPVLLGVRPAIVAPQQLQRNVAGSKIVQAARCMTLLPLAREPSLQKGPRPGA